MSQVSFQDLKVWRFLSWVREMFWLLVSSGLHCLRKHVESLVVVDLVVVELNVIGLIVEE